jgi:hypothetical protein
LSTRVPTARREWTKIASAGLISLLFSDEDGGASNRVRALVNLDDAQKGYWLLHFD